MRILPPTPQINIEVVETQDIQKGGFLHVVRRKIIFHYDDDRYKVAPTNPYTVDVIARKKPNAVAIIPYKNVGDQTLIFLRSSIRPAVAFAHGVAGDKNFAEGNLWEIPAGLIEPAEEPKLTARRELFEEMGFNVPLDSISQLGQPTYPAVGLSGETITYYTALLDDVVQYTPSLDGSPMEEGAAIYGATLNQLKQAINNGEIKDSKTELGIVRFLSAIKQDFYDSNC